jgi:hypothetical protein
LLGLRFSLKSFLGAVTFVALALASLLQPWRSWCPSFVLTGLLALMLFSIPCSIFAGERVRAFYVGFAIVSWGYFLLAFVPWFEMSVGRKLLANPIAEYICFAATGSLGDFPQFLKVTHTLFMFVLAYVGGLAASRCYVNSTKRSI